MRERNWYCRKLCPPNLRPWRAAAWTRSPPGGPPSPRLRRGSGERRRRRGHRRFPNLRHARAAVCRLPRLAVVLGLGVVVIGAGILRRSGGPAAKEPPKVVAPDPVKQPPMRPAPPKAIESSTRGQVVREVLPDIPRQARNTIHGSVKVSVRAAVDASGRVVSARLESAGPSKYLAKLTLEATRRWEFRPPTSQGNTLPSEWMLHFKLTRGGTRVRPAEISR